MSKLNFIGGLFCLGGLVLVIFHAVSTIVNPGEMVWKSFSLVDVISAEHLEWIDSISWYGIQKAIKYIVEAPLSILLFAVGLLTLLVSGSTEK